MSDENASLKQSYEYRTESVEGLEPVRGLSGSSTVILAGAASYWEKRAKKAERINTNHWRNGFSAGVAVCGVLAMVAGAVFHFI